jgi:hypothetical protein
VVGEKRTVLEGLGYQMAEHLPKITHDNVALLRETTAPNMNFFCRLSHNQFGPSLLERDSI